MGIYRSQADPLTAQKVNNMFSGSKALSKLDADTQEVTTVTRASTSISDPHSALPLRETVTLLRSLEQATQLTSCPVIQVVSAYSNEGVTSVTIALARAAASSMLEKKILVIHAVPPPRAAWGKELPTLSTLHEIASQALAPRYGDPAMAKIQVSVLSQQGGNSSTVASIHALLPALRERFDLILLDCSAILKDPLSNALAKVVDGSILVVEAERTRRPVTLHVKQLIESCGGRVLGAILNKRRFHIPQWLYRGR